MSRAIAARARAKGAAIEATAEALVLAAKAGIDPQLVIEISSLPGTGPQTGAMATRGPRILQRNSMRRCASRTAT